MHQQAEQNALPSITSAIARAHPTPDAMSTAHRAKNDALIAGVRKQRRHQSREPTGLASVPTPHEIATLYLVR